MTLSSCWLPMQLPSAGSKAANKCTTPQAAILMAVNCFPKPDDHQAWHMAHAKGQENSVSACRQALLKHDTCAHMRQSQHTKAMYSGAVPHLSSTLAGTTIWSPMARVWKDSMNLNRSMPTSLAKSSLSTNRHAKKGWMKHEGVTVCVQHAAC